jgi:hypothetical protein
MRHVVRSPCSCRMSLANTDMRESLAMSTTTRLLLGTISIVTLSCAPLRSQTVGFSSPAGPTYNLVVPSPNAPTDRWKTYVHLSWDPAPAVQISRITTTAIPAREYYVAMPARAPLLTVPPAAARRAARPVVTTALPDWYMASRVNGTPTLPTTGQTSVPIVTVVTTQQIVTIPPPRFHYGFTFMRCR